MNKILNNMMLGLHVNIKFFYGFFVASTFYLIDIKDWLGGAVQVLLILVLRHFYLKGWLIEEAVL